ncbi:uncharacterized protein LOC130810027 isoform X1 [Amaranthus tricolor]|uniref:uncharacterized protein LOC130810027 isoform X1 n=1 Tax=Amaranthus tricolor TaxID=29722 RepID=UPI0025909D6B|nr:uncharacterized protein LOC130810027 isoform X1 [Amaranthus tricolor]
MGSKDGSVGWSVFDTIKFLPATPDALMAEINAAIAALEYAQASTQLAPRAKSSNSVPCSVYDAEIAEEAYKLGCIALSEGKLDEGLQSLNISISKCPPQQIDVIAKIQSLISFTAQQFKMSSK